MTSLHARDPVASDPQAGSDWPRRKAAAPSLFTDMQEQARLLGGSADFHRLLTVLVAVDAVLILLHILQNLHDMQVIGGEGFLLESRRFRIDEELGYGEIFGYLKSLAIAAAFFACYRRARAPIFAALGFTFAVIVLDDSLHIHEDFGYLLAKALTLDPAFGLRPQDQGELMVWSALGVVVVMALAAGYRRSGREGRSLALIFLSLLAALVFFALAVDMLHMALAGSFRGAYRLGTVIEEGGEMLTLSFICAAAVAAARRAEPRPGETDRLGPRRAGGWG